MKIVNILIYILSTIILAMVILSILKIKVEYSSHIFTVLLLVLAALFVYSAYESKINK